MIHIKAPKFLKLVTFSDRTEGLCLMFFLIYKDCLTDRVINHEEIHWKQWKECLIVFFPILYFYFHFTRGYWENPFEKEAYDNDYDLSYLYNRKLYTWTKYI